MAVRKYKSAKKKYKSSRKSTSKRKKTTALSRCRPDFSNRRKRRRRTPKKSTVFGSIPYGGDGDNFSSDITNRARERELTKLYGRYGRYNYYTWT